jgi:hypothetical protein
MANQRCSMCKILTKLFWSRCHAPASNSAPAATHQQAQNISRVPLNSRLILPNSVDLNDTSNHACGAGVFACYSGEPAQFLSVFDSHQPDENLPANRIQIRKLTASMVVRCQGDEVLLAKKKENLPTSFCHVISVLCKNASTQFRAVSDFDTQYGLAFLN